MYYQFEYKIYKSIHYSGNTITFMLTATYPCPDNFIPSFVFPCFNKRNAGLSCRHIIKHKKFQITFSPPIFYAIHLVRLAACPDSRCAATELGGARINNLLFLWSKDVSIFHIQNLSEVTTAENTLILVKSPMAFHSCTGFVNLEPISTRANLCK